MTRLTRPNVQLAALRADGPFAPIDPRPDRPSPVSLLETGRFIETLQSPNRIHPRST